MQPFAKYHGLGNDFVIIDCRATQPPLTPALARWICDRHRGVGADGVLTVWPPRQESAFARMRVHNADGSESAMCGNGLRCVAQFLWDSQAQQSVPATLVVEAGERLYPVTRRGPQRCHVQMGPPAFAHPELPEAADPNDGRCTLSVAPGSSRQVEGHAVHFGNPHFVVFSGSAESASLDATAQQIGPQLESHVAFPQRTNVELVWDAGEVLHTVVYERGVGVTQACGSGACAVGVAAVARGLRPTATPIRVQLPGGLLIVDVDTSKNVGMEGEATKVFTGSLPMPSLRDPAFAGGAS